MVEVMDTLSLLLETQALTDITVLKVLHIHVQIYMCMYVYVRDSGSHWHYYTCIFISAIISGNIPFLCGECKHTTVEFSETSQNGKFHTM